MTKSKFTPLPYDNEINQNIRTCKQCRRHWHYADPEAALEHLRIHVEPKSASEHQNQSEQHRADDDHLKNWIRSEDEAFLEETNAGYLVILEQVNKDANFLLRRTADLAEGVLNPNRKVSELYSLPDELLRTFHRLVLFYLAVERAFYFTDQMIQKKDLDIEDEDVPFSWMGLTVLQGFSESVGRSLLLARKELCQMARSGSRKSTGSRFPLGPEYLCAWFMRRMIVRPVDNERTAADFYNDCLSTLVSI